MRRCVGKFSGCRSVSARIGSAAFALAGGAAFAQDAADAPAQPNPIDIAGTLQDALNANNISTSLFVFLMLTLLTLAPAFLVMTTSFVRIIVVFGFLRQAMATQQSPPNQVLIGLALFLTFFIMMPTWQRVNSEALQPYIDGEIQTLEEFGTAGMKPIREFMFAQLEGHPDDLVLFLDIAKMDPPETRDDVPWYVVVPAFMINELRTAFQMGFVIYIPFLVIDMVVASTLMAMGMMMLPPVFVSLPFKIILFVLVDGWYLLTGSLVQSFYT